MPAPINYGSQAGAAALCGKASTDILPDWLDQVDALIERQLGQGYKGATRTTYRYGDNTAFLVLPSVAVDVASVSENSAPLTTDYYTFRSPSRLIERKAFNLAYYYPYGPYRRTGFWAYQSEYMVTYTEPTVIPSDWVLTADYCAALIAMFADKFALDGIALAISTMGEAGGHGGSVRTGGSTSFPASLLAELRKAIAEGIQRGAIG